MTPSPVAPRLTKALVARPPSSPRGRGQMISVRYLCITSNVGYVIADVDGLNITNFELETITPATAPAEVLTLNVPSGLTT